MRYSKTKLLFLTAIISFIIVIFPNYKSLGAEKLTNYNIDVSFNEQDKLLIGSEQITYTNNYDKPLSQLVLHLYPDSYNQVNSTPSIGSSDGKALTADEIGSIKISDVKLNDVSTTYTDTKQVLIINPSVPLGVNDTISIKLNFVVKIPLGTDRMGYQNGVYSVTNWYPLMSIYDSNTGKWDENEYNPIGESNYSDASNYDVTLHTSKDIVTATTGAVIEKGTADNIKTINIKSYNTRDFVFMMSKYYKILSAEVDGIKIKSYYIDDGNSPNSKPTAEYLLDAIKNAFKFYNKSYGKYPYPQFTMAETYLSGGAMEYPQLIQMGKYDEISAYQRQNHSSWLEDAAVHEAGHQWWYVTVGDNEFKEPMMDESLNTYSTAYYFEKLYGKYNANSITMQIRNSLVKGDLNPIASAVDSFKNWDDYQHVIYDKGPEIFEDLRNRLGDDKMLKVLQTYFSKFEYKNGTINDFANVVGQIGGDKIKSYFIDAVHSRTYYPSNIDVSDSELKHINNLSLIDEIQNRETNTGLTLSSLLLKGMENEKVDIIIPSNLSADQEESLDAYLSNLKQNLNAIFDIPVEVIKDTAVTNDILKNNVIILGNIKNSKLLDSLTRSFPFVVTKTNIDIKNNILPLKNLTGTFIMKNPNANNKLMLVVYWTDSVPNYELLIDNTDQYIVNYDTGNDIDSKELRGQFK